MKNIFCNMQSMLADWEWNVMRNFSIFERPLPDLFIINNLDIYIFVFFNRQNRWKSYCVIIFQILILMGHRVQTKTERVKIACMLLEFGAKLDQRNKKGQQAIDLAETDVKSAVQQHANDVWVFAKVCKGVVDLSMNSGMEGTLFCKSIHSIEVIFIFSADR